MCVEYFFPNFGNFVLIFRGLSVSFEGSPADVIVLKMLAALLSWSSGSDVQ